MVKKHYLVAPDMGSSNDARLSFTCGKAPYARGSGDLASQELVPEVVRYLWGDSDTGQGSSPEVVLTASGQAATHLMIQSLRGQSRRRNHVVVTDALFGTTNTAWTMTYARHGDQVSRADPCDTQAFVDASQENTRAWFVEAVSNPAGRVPDFASLRAEADARGILLVVDGTLAVGMPKFKGKDWAHILTASLTKQAGNGQNENTGGALIVSPDFQWQARARKFPEFAAHFTNADNRIVLPDNPFGALAAKIGLYEGSGVITPRVAVSIAKSLPSMQSRVERMCRNAHALAGILCEDQRVQDVQLAGFHENANDLRARQYLGRNHFVILINLGDAKVAERFVNAWKFLHAVALGQRVTAISQPAHSTHRQYSLEKLAHMGIYPGTIRMSVGVEPRRELVEKMIQALAYAYG